MKEQLNKNVKKLAIHYYKNNNVSQNTVSKIFGINIRTFRNWYLLDKKGESLKRKNRVCTSYKIRKTHVQFLLEILKKNQSISIHDLTKILINKYPDLTVSEEHIRRIIRDNNITRKRTSKRHYPETRRGIKVNLKKEMKDFYKDVQKYNLKKVICIDEISVHVQMKSNYSRCNLGKRCVQKTSSNKVFKKYTMIVAINSKGVLLYQLFKKGGINAERMVNFLDVITKRRENNIIIMDNAPSHKSKLIQNKIKKSNNVLRYSVPYRPKTNAIETWFSILKYNIKKDKIGLTFEDLENNIRKSINMIKKETYKKIFEYAYIHCSKSKSKITHVSTWKKKLKIYKE